MSEELRRRIKATAQGTRHVLLAETYIKEWPSASRPVLFRCNDGNQYVVKGSQNLKMIFTDHIVGILGEFMGAPVGRVAFVKIPDELRSIEPKVSHMGQGLAHATLFIRDVTERAGIDHVCKSENLDRFGLLQVLYSWMQASDHQCVYQKSPPHLVFSVDHGHFLPSGPNWTIDTLRANQHLVQLDPWFSQCAIPKSSLNLAKDRLMLITEEDINIIVDNPPDEWGVTVDERRVLAEYLVERRARLIENLAN